MKRFALLLAAVVSGSGCVVDTTCDPMELSIQWTPVGANGLATTCYDLVGAPSTLYSEVAYMQIFVDDGYFDTLNCDVYGVTYTEADLSSGWHDIIFEGTVALDYATAPVYIRDVRSVYVDSCGVTYLDALPGEAYLEFKPDYCAPTGSTNWLVYSVSDVNYSSPDPILTVSTVGTTACADGIATPTPVPYGYYQLDYVEEWSSTPTYLSYSNCSEPAKALFYETPGPFDVPMYNQPVCF